MSGLLCLLPMHALPGGRDLLYLVSFRDFLRLLNCLLPELRHFPAGGGYYCGGTAAQQVSPEKENKTKPLGVIEHL